MQQDAPDSAYQPLPPVPAAPPPPPAPTATVPPTGGIPVEQFQQPLPYQGQPVPQPLQSTQLTQQPAAQQPPMQQPAATPQLSRAEQKQQARRELKQAIGHSNEVLAQVQTVFPFTFFPDTVTIDRGKMTISHRFFFKVAEVTSIRIEDILNATANIGPLFGSLKIATRFFGTDKVYSVHYLHRSDAIRIKRILQGYIIALQKDIDCSSLSTDELSRLLAELGSESPEEKR